MTVKCDIKLSQILKTLDILVGLALIGFSIY
jgi:hypothetical protein